MNFLAKDFKENDTGLEYIGRRNQQMGDGDLFAQFTDAATGDTIVVTTSSLRCLVIHAVLLNRSCGDESDPEVGADPCQFHSMDEPEGVKGGRKMYHWGGRKGRTLHLKGYGMPTRGSPGASGDLYVTLKKRGRFGRLGNLLSL